MKKRMYFPLPIAAFGAVFLLLQCAKVGSLSGGIKDSVAPRLDTVGSTPNYVTNANPRRIELRFDEWLSLKDAPTQVVVSPPLAKRPDIRLEGKKIVLELDKNEQLRPNTTYTIQFGTAIRDFHEENPVQDLRYVFSTGAIIDSLRLQGQVADALTGEAVENITVCLYDMLEDSVIRKERPYYFAKTDKNGTFILQNIKTGTFKIAGFDDKDQNLKWSGESERVAFSDTNIVVSAARRRPLPLLLFKNQARLRLIERHVGRYGHLRLGYTTTPPELAVSTVGEVPGFRSQSERVQDSLVVWYDMTAGQPFQLLVGGDTVAVKPPNRDEFLTNRRPTFADAAPVNRRDKKKAAPLDTKTITVLADQPPRLLFDAPITAFDTSRWVLSADTLPLRSFSVAVDSIFGRGLLLRAAWLPEKAHQLLLLPGAITDFWGVPNADTLRRIFNVVPEKQLGTLNLTAQDLVPGTSYVIQIFNGTNLDQERVFVAAAAEQRLVFGQLNVATYTARLITDTNGNGRWDTGSYFEKRQPEAVLTRKLEALRANWELEATISKEEKTRKK